MIQSLVLALALMSAWPADATDAGKIPGDRVSHQPLNGREVYVQSCAMCHTAGVGGAPRPWRGEDWVERARRGPAELMVSVLRGKGGMPPKGGNASLTTIEAYLALDYMLNGDK
jgi:cytochrome c5